MDKHSTEFERRKLAVEWMKCRFLVVRTVSEFIYWTALDEIVAQLKVLRLEGEADDLE